MILYLYTGSYPLELDRTIVGGKRVRQFAVLPQEGPIGPYSLPALLLHIDMYAISHRFGIDSLSALSRLQVAATLNTVNWEDDVFADNQEIVKNIMACARKIYESTPTSDVGLRLLNLRVLKAGCHHDKLLMHPLMKTLLGENPLIVMDLWGSESMGIMRCSNCQQDSSIIHQVCKHSRWTNYTEQVCMRKFVCTICQPGVMQLCGADT